MQPSEVTIEVRDTSLTRSGQILPQYWSDVKAILHLRSVGEWSLSLPVELPAAQALAQPGSGLLINGPDGVLMSGPMESVNRKQSAGDPVGMYVFAGVTDDCVLGDALAWPDPTNGVVASQALAYDNRTGAAESILRALADANVGPSAPASRRGLLTQHLTLAPDLGRGASVPISVRFPNLLQQMAIVARTAGLGFHVIQSGDVLLLEFWTPRDLSKLIRMDVVNGQLTASEYALSVPTVTRGIVAGQGEGAARTLLERTSADATAAETLWGRRIEVFKDQRNTNDQAQLEQSGDELLANGGRTRVDTKITPTDDSTMRYGRDWALGDLVSVVVGGVEVPEVVTSVGIGISKDGVAIGARVGESDGS